MSALDVFRQRVCLVKLSGPNAQQNLQSLFLSLSSPPVDIQFGGEVILSLLLP